MYSSSLKNAGNDAAQSAENAMNTVSNKVSHAASKVSDTFNQASDKVSSAADATKRQIRTNPVQSSLISFAVGYLLARLIRS